MSEENRALKVYADNGLRTVENWSEFGREVKTGAKPRTDTAHRGKTVPLYSRDQTNIRTPSRAGQR
ncbi:MAG: hypothetical protein ACREJC_16075 [Tepidisphaeraceae bacterium]